MSSTKMKLDFLVLSDSHGRRAHFRAVAEAINFRPTAILFLGDGLRDLDVLADIPTLRDVPLVSVAGNCDGYFFGAEDSPIARTLTYGSHRIFMTHGHRFGVRAGPGQLIEQAMAENADVVLYGHTHVAAEWTLTRSDRQGNPRRILVANPGSLGEPRDGGPCRFGVLTLTETAALFGHGDVDVW